MVKYDPGYPKKKSENDPTVYARGTNVQSEPQRVSSRTVFSAGTTECTLNLFEKTPPSLLFFSTLTTFINYVSFSTFSP